jgi:hypothetical protein
MRNCSYDFQRQIIWLDCFIDSQVANYMALCTDSQPLLTIYSRLFILSFVKSSLLLTIYLLYRVYVSWQTKSQPIINRSWGISVLWNVVLLYYTISHLFECHDVCSCELVWVWKIETVFVWCWLLLWTLSCLPFVWISTGARRRSNTMSPGEDAEWYGR